MAVELRLPKPKTIVNDCILEMADGWDLRTQGYYGWDLRTQGYYGETIHFFRRSDGWTADKIAEIREAFGID